jgi:hypothetical protein
MKEADVKQVMVIAAACLLAGAAISAAPTRTVAS